MSEERTFTIDLSADLTGSSLMNNQPFTSGIYILN
ncbi:Uncharacterised protein [Serratia quinivorans]|nr:Uncharacterised protein [Serratia quinivorans]